jgi:hypothetical protein
MKARKSFTLLIVTCGILAGSAVYAQHKAGEYEPAGSGKIALPLARTSSTDASYDVGPFSTYRPVLATGDGSREVDVYCNTCHSPIYITMQPPLSAEAWAAEVTKMRKTFGADIPDEVAQKVTHYLGTHYTPETRKR